MSLLTFNEEDKVTEKKTMKPTIVDIEIERVSPELNPYKNGSIPIDLFDFLLPDGSKFGMFSDPYATMQYVDPHIGNRNGRYWLEQKLEEYNFTEREITLLEFLSKHRVATRNQIQRVVFSDVDRKSTIVDFLKKSRQRGFITAFSWVSPLNDERKKPLVYGLTRVGAQAAKILFQKELPDEFWFHPIQFPPGKGPNMNNFFIDLAANELYSELVRIDRVISWERRPQIRLVDGTYYKPAFTFEVVKNIDETRLFWVEVVRVGKDWLERTKQRFENMQNFMSKLSPYQKPTRVIVIADGDSRIPVLAKLAAKYMPDVGIRFTTDERLLKGLGVDTFITWNQVEEKLQLTRIPYLLEDYEGITASKYLSRQTLNIEDEDDFFE